MTCNICDWLRTRFGGTADDRCDRLWHMIDNWEREHSNDRDLWDVQSAAHRALIDKAKVIEDEDPEAAFNLYRQAADAGSPLAMERVGWHYRWSSPAAVDQALARKYYHRAICAGSWSATLPYARLLAEAGDLEESEQVLEDGIASNFIPAYFWLAKLRLARSKSRGTCRRVRPLLEHASAHGHPGAKRLLAGLMLLGKYGFRQIPAGFRLVSACSEGDENWTPPGDGTPTAIRAV